MPPDGLDANQLDELFDSLPIPFLVGRESDRRVLAANQAFLDLIGYELDEVLGVTPPFPWWNSEADVSVGFTAGSVITRTYRCKDGRPLVVEVTSHGFADGLLLGIVTDLTDRRHHDQQLVQSGKLTAIGELAAGVAHEINNPLFAILGLTEFLLKETDEGTRAHRRLELIRETGLEIKEIVRALLDFAGENTEERRLVEIEDVVRSTVELVRRTNAHKWVELVDTYDAGGAVVLASPNQVKQVLLNLIANARQAMPLGGTVYVEVSQLATNVLVTVADDGPGIEPALLSRIFEPFFTTKRDVGGTGLGLSVSLGIAESHGGTLIGTSEPGVGARFTMRLPLATGADR
jgi:PAS domain S-box-containing protein